MTRSNEPADDESLLLALTLEEFCGRFEKAWPTPARLSISALLEEAPELHRTPLLRELLALELELRRAAGETPKPSDYVDVLPCSREVIDTFFDDAKTRVEAHGPTAGGERLPAGFEPRRFAGYELLEEIGRGGMGVVYRAHDERLGRDVALKMITADRFSSEEVVKRFEIEAGAAARLDHPGIVPVFEYGHHENRAYLVMGLVKGPSLQDSLNQGPWPPDAAARLLVDIARAVQAAHERGIIHRDLKPANILLDEHHRPRITDFGLAKHTDGQEQLTVSGQLLGTPGFMPPEQARGERGAADPTSDVYSLGAVLYNVLTGRPPFQAPTLAATLRLVAEVDPVPPRQLDPDVPRDLETLTLRCLSKERAQRPRSAEVLAAELERYLRGEPIHSRPVSAFVRASKWISRNPLAALLGTALVLALLGGTIVSTVLNLRAQESARRSAEDSERAREAAEQERLARIAADAEARRANTIRDYLLLDMLGAANPEALGKDVTVLRVLDAAVERAGRRFAEHPELEAIVRHVAAEAYLQLGNLERSREQSELASAMYEQWFEPSDRRRLDGLRLKANLMTLQGRHDESSRLLADLYERARRFLGEEDETTRSIQLSYGDSLQVSGRHAEARPLLEAVVRSADDDPALIALRFRALSSLAGSYQATGDLDRAEATLTEWISTSREFHGERHLSTAAAIGNLANLLHTKRLFADAVEQHRRSIEILEEILEPNDWRIAFSHGRLGFSLRNLGRRSEAIQALERCVEGLGRHFGENEFQTQHFLKALADELHLAGEWEKAASAYERRLRSLLEDSSRHGNRERIAAALLDCWIAIDGDASRIETRLAQFAGTLAEGANHDSFLREAWFQKKALLERKEPPSKRAP